MPNEKKTLTEEYIYGKNSNLENVILDIQNNKCNAQHNENLR